MQVGSEAHLVGLNNLPMKVTEERQYAKSCPQCVAAKSLESILTLRESPAEYVATPIPAVHCGRE